MATPHPWWPMMTIVRVFCFGLMLPSILLNLRTSISLTAESVGIAMVPTESFPPVEIAAIHEDETPTDVPATSNGCCQVLIDNHKAFFHFEVLESIMMQFPLPQEAASCPGGRVEFTFFLAGTAGSTFQRNRVKDWQSYALSSIASSTTKPSTSRQTPVRSLKAVVRNDKDGIAVIKDTNFQYQIRASCYCLESDIGWLKNTSANDGMGSGKRYCVFHEACGQMEKSNQAFWISPHYPRYFLPTNLPKFSHERLVNQSTVNFCVLGAPNKRNYPMLAQYLNQTHSDEGQDNMNIHIYQLGKGEMHEAMEPHQRVLSIFADPNFVAFQREVYDKCDVVLALITKSIAPFYFDKSIRKKLSASIPQAIAYGRGIVIHEDLARLYKKHLEEIPVETHDDSLASFAKAMDRMIVRQKQLKGLPATALGARNSRNEAVQVTVSQAQNGTSQRIV